MNAKKITKAGIALSAGSYMYHKVDKASSDMIENAPKFRQKVGIALVAGVAMGVIKMTTLVETTKAIAED